MEELKKKSSYNKKYADKKFKELKANRKRRFAIFLNELEKLGYKQVSRKTKDTFKVSFQENEKEINLYFIDTSLF